MAAISPDSARGLADALVVVHFAYVSFVVFGFLAILIGLLLRKRWARNFWLRVVHLAMIGIVAVQAVLGIACPLTVWEFQLRDAAGEQGYRGGFIEHWVHRLMYYDFPLWVFTALYVGFGLAVLAAFVFAPPRRPKRAKAPAS
jgi:hypothetical protein